MASAARHVQQQWHGGYIPGIHSESQTIIQQAACTRQDIVERPVINIPLPSTDPHPNHIIVEKPKAPTADIDEIQKEALRAYNRQQAELEAKPKQQDKHPLLIIKEQIEAHNARGYYPHLSLEDAYAGYMMWLKQEEEEELEEWRETREHEAEMWLRQQEKYLASIREVEIKTPKHQTSQ